MTSYRVGIGSDVALASLTVLDPQPDPGPGIQVTRRSFAANGTISDQGKYIELEWSAYTDAADYQTLLGQFGLGGSTTSADVTVYVRNEIYDWIRMNGTAIRPIPGSTVDWGDRQSRPLDITILIKNLTDVATPDARAKSSQDDITISESVTVSVA